MQGRTLAARSAAWTERMQAVDAELAAIQAEIDERCFSLYGIDEEDRRAITEGFGGSGPDAETAEDDADTEDEAEAEAAADTATLAAELVSWAAGVAFGRFDVRLATGARELPAEPEPFDPLPVCSPAMLTGDDGLPLSQPPAGYPLSLPEDGILVDDPGHPRDLTAAVRAVFDTVFGTSADTVWQEAAALLDPKGHDLRTWLARDFFGHHLARHSKSRRKAPILWQLGPASARYSTWCYAHRLTRDSLFALSPRRRRAQARARGAPAVEPRPGGRPQPDREAAGRHRHPGCRRRRAPRVRRRGPPGRPALEPRPRRRDRARRGPPLAPRPAQALGQGAQEPLGRPRRPASTTGRTWRCTSGPSGSCPSAPPTAASPSPTGSRTSSGSRVPTASGASAPRPTRSVEELVAERTSPAVKAALADLLAAPAPAAGGRTRGRKGE